jgi:hypothetical protein
MHSLASSCSQRQVQVRMLGIQQHFCTKYKHVKQE